MLNRLKKTFASPWALPLKRPAKLVARWGYMPIKDFVKRVKSGLEDDDGSPIPLRVIGSVTMDYWADGHTKWMGWTGAILGGCAAIGGAALGVHALGAGAIGMVAAGITAASAGIIAGPFIVAGVVAAATGVCALAIGGVPAFFEGFYLAHKQSKALKAQSAAVQAVPQLAAAPQDFQQQAAEMIKQIRQMPSEAQAPLLKELNAQYRGDATLGDTDSLVQAIAALPANDQVALVKSIQTTLKDAFDIASRQESDAAMALHEPVKTGGPLKLKMNPNA